MKSFLISVLLLAGISAALAGCRMGGIHNNLLKDSAHLWMGFLVGTMLFNAPLRPPALTAFLWLIAVELYAALVLYPAPLILF